MGCRGREEEGRERKGKRGDRTKQSAVTLGEKIFRRLGNHSIIHEMF